MEISVKDILIPLVSAFGASLLTHWLTLKRSRADILLKIRLEAYTAMHLKLMEIYRYCVARAGEASGSDLAPTTESLSEAENKSVLEHWHAFRYLHDAHFVYFPKRLRTVFEELEHRLSIMSSIELQRAINPDLVESGRFDQLADEVKSTIKKLHEHSPLH